MINYKPGDIVLTDFPFIDGTGSKERPALVISTQEYNESRPHLLAMPITSQIASFESFEIKNWWEVGLDKPSEILYQISTIPQRFIAEKIGQLSRGHLKAVMQHIAEKIGIT